MEKLQNSKNSNINAKNVEESSFTHKDAYELGAMLIAIGDAEDTITLIHNNPNYQKVMKQTEYRLSKPENKSLKKN